jgi:hypothetical protein
LSHQVCHSIISRPTAAGPWRCLLLLPALLVAGIFPSAVAGPLQPNRPGQADPPTVLATGEFQVEGGFNFERETDDGANVDNLSLPGLELRFGVLENVELQIAADGFVWERHDDERNRSGGSDVELDMRIRLADQLRWRPALAIEFGLSLPTGSGFNTSDGYDPELEVLYAWDIGERWNLNGNFDFASESQGQSDSQRHSVFRPQLALGLSINDRVGTFIEYYGVIEEDAANQHSVDAGVTYLLSDDVQLDFSAGAGLNNAAPDYFVAAGIAWRAPR